MCSFQTAYCICGSTWSPCTDIIPHHWIYCPRQGASEAANAHSVVLGDLLGKILKRLEQRFCMLQPQTYSLISGMSKAPPCKIWAYIWFVLYETSLKSNLCHFSGLQGSHRYTIHTANREPVSNSACKASKGNRRFDNCLKGSLKDSHTVLFFPWGTH